MTPKLLLHRHKAIKGNVSDVTAQNERRATNALMKWQYKIGEKYLDSFEFKKQPHLDSNSDSILLSALTSYEHEALYRVHRTHNANHNELEQVEY